MTASGFDGLIGRRAFLLGSSAVTLCALPGCVTAAGRGATMSAGAAPAPARTGVYDRPLHVVYARTGGKAFGTRYSDDDFLRFFDMVPGGMTAAVPFLLNVPDASIYAPMLNRMRAKGIVIVPGVGAKPGDGPINMPRFKGMAKNYRPFTDYIRLENLQGYHDLHGAAPIQDMIDYCLSLGFKHIMMNPWPRKPGGGAVPFTNPELDATIHQVLLKHNRATHDILPNPENWYPGNQVRIDEIRRYRPSIDVLINYESAPQHEALAKLERETPGASRDAMNITATRIAQGSKSLRWCPPFTVNYDPVALGTWPWIAARLGDFKSARS